MESYYSPQLFQRSSNEEYILIGTGGETHGGSLYAFDLKCFTNYCSEPVELNIFLIIYFLFLFSIQK
jgi:hypothetical protein